MTQYTEIFRLKKMLEDCEIPFEFREERSLNRKWLYLSYPQCEEFVCDAVQNPMSYGSSQDLIEIMGLLTDEERKYDDVAGYLTADNVFSRIKAHYERSDL